MKMGGELHVLSVFEPAEASRRVKADALLQTARDQFARPLSSCDAGQQPLG
jgi:hypothetical protein